MSDIPELRKLIKDGENGYIYGDDFDIDRLSQIPKFSGYNEEINPIWKDVLDGKL